MGESNGVREGVLEVTRVGGWDGGRKITAGQGGMKRK